MSGVVILANYKGLQVSFDDDGWFNATTAAKQWSKAPAEWLRLPSTTSYLRALKRKYGKFPHLKSQRGQHGGGTWLHPKLAVRFAQWLDVDFAVWCDEQIDQLIHGGQQIPFTQYAQRIAFEGVKAKSEQKGRIGAKLMNERRWEKPGLQVLDAAWKLTMEPGLFAALEKTK